MFFLKKINKYINSEDYIQEWSSWAAKYSLLINYKPHLFPGMPPTSWTFRALDTDVWLCLTYIYAQLDELRIYLSPREGYVYSTTRMCLVLPRDRGVDRDYHAWHSSDPFRREHDTMSDFKYFTDRGAHQEAVSFTATATSWTIFQKWLTLISHGGWFGLEHDTDECRYFEDAKRVICALYLTTTHCGIVRRWGIISVAVEVPLLPH